MDKVHNYFHKSLYIYCANFATLKCKVNLLNRTKKQPKFALFLNEKPLKTVV